jgi:hypothetical protein
VVGLASGQSPTEPIRRRSSKLQRPWTTRGGSQGCTRRGLGPNPNKPNSLMGALQGRRGAREDLKRCTAAEAVPPKPGRSQAPREADAGVLSSAAPKLPQQGGGGSRRGDAQGVPRRPGGPLQGPSGPLAGARTGVPEGRQPKKRRAAAPGGETEKPAPTFQGPLQRGNTPKAARQQPCGRPACPVPRDTAPADRLQSPQHARPSTRQPPATARAAPAGTGTGDHSAAAHCCTRQSTPPAGAPGACRPLDPRCQTRALFFPHIPSDPIAGSRTAISEVRRPKLWRDMDLYGKSKKCSPCHTAAGRTLHVSGDFVEVEGGAGRARGRSCGWCGWWRW